MSFSPLLDNLIKAFTCLPGVGPKSAQRMAFYLLERNRDGGKHLAVNLQQALDRVGNCHKCRIFSEQNICNICNNSARDNSTICVVESPIDVAMIEQMGSYRGLYFVLMGHLSPMDNVGPEEIGANLFKQRLAEFNLKEVIMATSTTVGGEATAYYLAEICKAYKVLTTRIAHGVPMGGELEYLDSNTVVRALDQRRVINAVV